MILHHRFEDVDYNAAAMKGRRDAIDLHVAVAQRSASIVVPEGDIQFASVHWKLLHRNPTSSANIPMMHSFLRSELVASDRAVNLDQNAECSCVTAQCFFFYASL